MPICGDPAGAVQVHSPSRSLSLIEGDDRSASGESDPRGPTGWAGVGRWPYAGGVAEESDDGEPVGRTGIVDGVIAVSMSQRTVFRTMWMTTASTTTSEARTITLTTTAMTWLYSPALTARPSTTSGGFNRRGRFCRYRRACCFHDSHRLRRTTHRS